MAAAAANVLVELTHLDEFAADRPYTADLSLNGRWLAFAGYADSSNVTIVDLRTGGARSLSGHKHWVYSVRFSPDSAHLASASFDHDVIVWSVEDGAEQRRFTHAGGAFSVAFSPDGTCLAAGVGGGTYVDADAGVVHLDGVKLWSVETGELLAMLPTPDAAVLSVCFSPNARWLAAADARNRMYVWEFEERAATEMTTTACASGAEGEHAAAAVVPRAAITTAAAAAHARQIVSQKPTHVGGECPPETITTVAFSPCGSWLATGGQGDGCVGLWRTSDWSLSTLLACNADGSASSNIASVAFTRDSVSLVANFYMGKPVAQVWDIATRTKRAEIEAGATGNFGNSIAFSPSGLTMAVASLQRVDLFDLAPLIDFTRMPASALALRTESELSRIPIPSIVALPAAKAVSAASDRLSLE